MAVETPVCDFGWRAPDFSLPGVDGKTWTLADVRGPRGTLVMFLCNHCPYVQAIIRPLVADVAALKALGVGAVAIMSNDTEAYPEDGFENMKRFDAGLGLRYRGRFDASGRQAAPGARRELLEGMTQIAETGRGPAAQTPSLGCSIKWRV